MRYAKRSRELVIRFWLLLMLPAIVANAQAYTNSDTTPFRIVGYYSLKAAASANLDSFPFENLTHVNLYFLNPDTAGNFPQDFSQLRPFIKKAHSRGVKVLPSIAGGGRHDYYHALLEDAKRNRVVQDLLSIVLENDFDGIDIDLEGNDIDSNYEKFVTETSRAFHAKNKLVTAAIAIFYKDVLTDSALAAYDFVNLMSYDHTGPWRPENPGPHSTYHYALADLNYFLTERHIPANRITLGLPFYGYGFGPKESSSPVNLSYRQILDSLPGAASKDSGYLPSGSLIHYNGEETVRRKTALALEKASGIMIWQIAGDAAGDESLLQIIREYSRKNKAD